MKGIWVRVRLLAFCAAGIWLLPLALWVYDLHKDRAHTIVVISPTPVFVGHGTGACDHSTLLVTAYPTAAVNVRRIRYWKNCATIDVSLSDGRTGYIVSGVGNFSVSPPSGD